MPLLGRLFADVGPCVVAYVVVVLAADVVACASFAIDAVNIDVGDDAVVANVVVAASDALVDVVATCVVAVVVVVECC